MTKAKNSMQVRCACNAAARWSEGLLTVPRQTRQTVDICKLSEVEIAS